MSAKLAADPDTPPEKLAKLAARFPGALLRNPVLPLLLLEQPDWLTGLSEKTLLALMQEPAVPATLLPVLLQTAATHATPLLRLAAAGHPGLPTRQLAKFKNDDDPHVRNLAQYRYGPRPAAAALPAAIEATLRLDLYLGFPTETSLATPIGNLLQMSSWRPGGLPATALPWASEILAPDDYFELLARHAKGLPIERLLELVAPMRNRLAAVWPELLKRLTTFVAPARLPELARNPAPLVRRLVAQHAATPPALLAVLATDENEDVQRTVAENLATPPEALAQLAAAGGMLRYLVAEHTAPARAGPARGRCQ